jgi:cell division protein ZipA
VSPESPLRTLPRAFADPHPPAPPEERDYGPDEAVEWTLDLAFAGPVVVTTEEVDAAFPRERIRRAGFTLYGIPADAARWTYVRAKGSPALWRAVALSTDIVDPSAEDGAPASMDDLRSFHTDVACQALGLRGARVCTREPAEAAASRAQRYADARRDANRDAVVVLRAPPGSEFDGRKVWDTLCSLGLEWGNMDLFHWNNPSDVGHDVLFSAWTSTPPGYFLPEEVRAGRLRVEDLVFGFHVARSGDPHGVLSQMIEGARFVRDRLGGRLEDEEGNAYDETAGHAAVRFVLERLAQADLRPGDDTTLRIF